MAGDRKGHDDLLIEKLRELASTADVVVLAQASMARVLPSLSTIEQDKFLSSPRFAMEQVKNVLSSLSLSSEKQ